LLHLLLLVKVDLLDWEVPNCKSIRPNEDSIVRFASKVSFALYAESEFIFSVIGINLKIVWGIRSVIFSYRFIVFDSDPYTLAAPKLGWTNETYSAALVKAFFYCLDLATSTNGDIRSGRRIGCGWFVSLRETTDLVTLLVCEDSICCRSYQCLRE
jgi:hypothetical protein